MMNTEKNLSDGEYNRTNEDSDIDRWRPNRIG